MSAAPRHTTDGARTGRVRRAGRHRDLGRHALLAVVLSACATPAGPGTPAGPDVPPPAATPALPSPLAWMTATSSPTPLYEAQGAAVNGQLYVFGGFWANIDDTPMATRAAHAYDPATDAWRSLRDIPEPVTHAGVAVDGPIIYVAGGFLGDHPGPQTDRVWAHDTRTDTWTALPPLPAALGAGALTLVGRNLHFFGGTERDADGAYLRDDRDHWALNVDAPTTWRPRAPLPSGRNHLGAAVLDGRIYAIGGQHLGDEASGNVTDVTAYDPMTDTWTAAAALPFPLGHITASTVVWNGRIVVAGGVTGAATAHAIEGQESAAVLAYDPAGNRWSALTALPGRRQSPVAAVMGGELVVTTGSDSVGPLDTTFVGR